MFEYAIKVLMSELRNCKDARRIDAKLNFGRSDEWNKKIKELEAAIEKLKVNENIFTMELEQHTPKNPDKPCHECVLCFDPMCLDKSYCKFKETGKTWKKKLKGE